MILAHKIRLKPNNKQSTYFAKASGTARFAYNWALNEWTRRREAGEKVNEAKLRRDLNAIKKDAFPWMQEVTKCAVQLSIMDLGQAFENFFAKRAAYPKFKKKGEHDHFAISNDHFAVEGTRVRIPKLGWVRMTEALRFTGKIMGAVISRNADHWDIAIQVEMPDPEPIHSPDRESQAVGIDMGVKDRVVLSDGSKITGRKPQKAAQSRLRRLQQSLSRKQGAKKEEKKSKNYRKAQKRLQRLYARMRNIRQDETHKLTTLLTEKYAIIGVEDLDVQQMASNHSLARSVMDMSFYEFRRQLEYKARLKGGRVVLVDRYYPSSKTCSICGYMLEELALSERSWVCPACNTAHDRDGNAAVNVKQEAVRLMTEIR